jgi:multifunctional beta-oxidation protein
VIINNAGILRDKSFAKMSDAEWKAVHGTHLRGTFKVTKAVWPHFMKQGYGRIVNTASAVGLYGNFGQTNYSAAKAGIWGLSSTLAIEGKKFNILVNTVAPNAGTAMTATILPSEVVEELKPDYVAPLVVALSHKSCKVSGNVYEVGSGWIAAVRWQRSDGAVLHYATVPTVEQVSQHWNEVVDFSGKAPEYPTTTQESFSKIMNLTKKPNSTKTSGNESTETKFEYGKKDSILYNLGIGCQADELDWVYENSSNFGVVPSFAVIPAFAGMMSVDMNSVLEDFSPVMLLHGEQYIELADGKMSVEGQLISTSEVVQVSEKAGKGTVVVAQVTTRDSKGKVVAISEGTTFNRKARAKKVVNGTRRPLALESPKIPTDRSPDAVKRQFVAKNAAVVYRLSGDSNPLHIDPKFAKSAGFPRPILHGLCTMGMATHHVLQSFPGKLVKAIKVRFVKHVFPGEEIETQMWRVSLTRIVLQVRAIERNEIVISGAFLEFLDAPPKQEIPSDVVSTKSSASKAENFFKKMSESYAKLPDSFKVDQVKKVGGVFVFNVEGNTFFIDLKNGKGQVGVGPSPQAPDITIIVGDKDFDALATGKMKGQAAFLKGLVKIKGNMMLAMKLDSVFKAFASLSASKL